MSTPQIRRADKVMSQAQTLATVQQGYCGRLATIGEDGYPYCVPLLYVWMDEELYVHKARGAPSNVRGTRSAGLL